MVAPAKASLPSPEAEFLEQERRARETALQAALETAARSNQQLADRVNEMERALSAQREREAQLSRDTLRYSLLLAGGIAGLAVFAVASIAWTQIRNSRQAPAPALPAVPQPAAPLLSVAAPPAAVVPAPQAEPAPIVAAAAPVAVRVEPPRADPGPAAPVVPVRAAPYVPAESADSLLALGQQRLQDGEPESALVLFQRATDREPAHAGAWLKRGIALEKLQRTSEALEAYDMAIALDPSFTVAYLGKAGLLNRLSRFDDALQCYEDALGGQPPPAPPAGRSNHVA